MRYWYKIHKWTSLICAIFFLLLCITGLPLLFKQEISSYNSRQNTEISQRTASYAELWAGVDAGEKLIQQQYPHKIIRAITAEPEKGRILFRMAGRSEKENGAGLHLSMSSQLAFYPQNSILQDWDRESVKYPILADFMHEMHIWHIRLGLGKDAMLFLGFMCFFSLICLISGIFIYAPFMRRTYFAEIDKRNSIFKYFGWHKFLGIISATWAALLCFSGIMIVVFAFAYSTYTHNASVLAAHSIAGNAKYNSSFSQAFIFMQQKYPQKNILSVEFPDRKNNNQYVFSIADKALSASRLKGQLVFVGQDNKGQLQNFTQPLPLYLSLTGQLMDLHLYNHDSIVLKIIWAVLDIITIIVILTGTIGWWKKKFALVTRSADFSAISMGTLSGRIIWQIPVIIMVLSLLAMLLPLPVFGCLGTVAAIVLWDIVFIIGLYNYLRNR